MSQSGTLIQYPDFPSELVEDRNVDIWVPPSYDRAVHDTYPVIYMHDGQNLFEDSLCGFGVEWAVDETVVRLSSTGEIPECIVVGIWNTAKRYPEYQPQKPYQELDSTFREQVTSLYGGEPISDNYLAFIVNELKPFVDSNFRTRSERESTYIMGSSMGGLVSIYAICEYPEIFCGAACLSTHWVTRADLESGEMARVMQQYLIENLPSASNHKIYFDYGTAGLDSYYEEHQLKIDEIMRKKGFTPDKNWMSRKFPGEDHNEIYWQKRLHIPLLFLLEKIN